MIYQILNGDSLAYSFPESKIEGSIIVIREAFIDGPLTGNDLQTFWHSRSEYIGVTGSEYHDKVVSEFEKIIQAPAGSEFNLWFEYDLFCQVNMWFVLSILNSIPGHKKVYAVYTSHLNKSNKHFWNGFGPAGSEQLQVCYADRIALSVADLQYGEELWSAYKKNNFEKLSHLAKSQSPAFPYLEEVVQAHIERFPKNGEAGRPEKVIADIIKNVSADFPTVFQEFYKRESIYGFGDTQLKIIYDKVVRSL